MVINSSDDAQEIRVTEGSTFTTTLAAHSINTYTWADGGGGASATGPITGLAGKCIDIAAANPANGTAINLYQCNGTDAQTFTVGGDGTVRALGKCMDIAGGGTGNGSQVQLYDCNGTGAQIWQGSPDGTLRNPQSGRCLDVTANNPANGTRLQIWDCFAGPNQRWDLPG